VSRSRRPAAAFLLVAATIGTALALALPAFGGYDEPVHFLRAWQVADGTVFGTQGTTADGVHDFGGDVPAELVADIRVLLVEGMFSPGRAQDTWDHLGDDAPGGPREFVGFSGAAVYSPVPYLPSAVAIRAGRVFGASTLLLLFLARFASLGAFVALVLLAFRRFPGRAWTLAALAVLPVVVFQAASVSADTVTIALVLLVLAYAARFTVGSEPISRGALAECAAAVVALALAKQPYWLFALALTVPALRRREIRLVVGATLAGAAVVAAAWSAWAADRHVPQDFAPAYIDEGNYAYRDVDPDEQLTHVRERPWEFAAVVVRTFAHDGTTITRDAVTQTAWWRVPWWATLGLALTLVALAFGDAQPSLGRASSVAIGLLAVAVLLVSVLLGYAGWNAVEAPRVDAFQGRYLFPVAAAALLAVPSRWARRSLVDSTGGYVVAACALVDLAVVAGIVRMFY